MSNEEFQRLIIAKLDKMDERMDAINATLVRNTVSLEVHEARTTVAEENFKAHVAAQIERDKEVDAKLKPLRRAYAIGTGAVLAAGGLISAVRLAKDLGLF